MKGMAEKTVEKGGDVDYSGRQCETVLNPQSCSHEYQSVFLINYCEDSGRER